jgi:hypothetical protein
MTIRAGGERGAAVRHARRASEPLRIVFHRQDDDACCDRVVFSSPRLDQHLAETGPTTIDLPAQLPGEIRFA